jgi:dipeptidyl aminopeptidase/acylaminoacyl peptidase
VPARPLTPADLARQVAIGQVAVSRDGRLVAYTRREVRAQRDQIHLWLVPAAGGSPRRLTVGAHKNTLPRFSPDGEHLAFLSGRERDVDQVWVLPVAGGEPWRLTSFKRGVADLDWHPGGRALVVAATDGRSDRVVGERDDGEPTARLISRIDWRLDGVGVLTHPAHLHVVPLASPGDGAARPRRLTSGAWSASRPRVSHDGSRVAYLADPRPDADVDPRPAVWSVPFAGGEPRRETDLPGPALRHAYEDDGSLVVLGHDVVRPADDDPPRLWHVPAEGPARLLSGAVDRFLGEAGTQTDLIDWFTDHDDAGRITTVADDGCAMPVRLDDDGAHPLADRALGPLVHSIARGGGTVAATMSIRGGAAEVYALEEGGPRRLTRHGGAWLRRFASARVEEVRLDGPAGPIQTFLVHPPGEAGRARALVLDVHGGPTGSWGPTPPLEALVLAARGYVVALPNIRGSHNGGREWIAALRGRWGDVDAADCHAVLDGLVEHGVADPARLGCLGLSYGGFVVNWLVGTSDRFAAAVSENGVTNQVSTWANCDLGAVYDTAAGLGDATTPEGVESLWRMSPLRNVAAVRTPLLMLQAESDMRCPAADNEQLFVALRWLGRTVEYVLYPEEAHAYQGYGRFDRRIDRHERVLAWFLRHMPADPV